MKGVTPHLVIIDEVQEWPRRLREGFAEKLDLRGIKQVFRKDATNPHKFNLVWANIDGVWTPQSDDTYYDDHRTGENID